MKFLLLLLVLLSKIGSEPTECVKRSKDLFLEEKGNCKSLYGVEKSNCIDTAKTKMRLSNDECRKNLIDCISKAVVAKNESKKLCSKNEDLERANCLKSSDNEFAKAKTNCRSI